MAFKTKLDSLANQGAIAGRAITKAAVSFSLASALFVVENGRQETPLPRNKRRLAFEGADNGRATERHWLLGVAIAKKCADAVTEVLATDNEGDGAGMVARLGRMLVEDAAQEDVRLTDANGNIIWAALAEWIATGEKRAAKTALEKLETMARSLDKVSEDATGDGETLRRIAAAAEALMAKARDMAKGMNARADAFDLAAEAARQMEERAAA